MDVGGRCGRCGGELGRSFKDERKRNWLWAEFIRKGIEQARAADEEGGGGEPGDEIDALRGKLIAELRRRPGDIPSLIRRSEVIARMIADQGRISPQRRARMEEGIRRLFQNLGITLAGEEEKPPPDN